LASLTGNRRFWPVEVKRIDIKAFNLVADQLWAEASLREATGESIVLDEKLWPAAAKQQAKRELMNPFVEPLAEAIGDREGYIFAADLWKLLGIEPGRVTQNDYNRIGKAMKVLGFQKTQKRLGSVRATAYQKGRVDQHLKPIKKDYRWVLSSWIQ
jgi:predicted P-loop ATPase